MGSPLFCNMSFSPNLSIVKNELNRIQKVAAEPIELHVNNLEIVVDWKVAGPLRFSTNQIEDEKDEYWFSNLQRLHQEYLEEKEKTKAIPALEAQIHELKAKVALQQKEIFGTSSEKQATQLDSSAAENNVNILDSKPEEKNHKVRDIKSYTGRKKLPENLPREKVIYSMPVSERICECCNGKLHKVGEESVEKLTVVREHHKVRVIVTEKYSCHDCDKFYVAKAPKSMIPGSSFDTPEFLANIAVKKFQFGMPYDRQEKYFRSIGLPFNRTTLANLMNKSSDLLAGVYECLREQLLSQTVIHADETIMQVLKEEGRKPQQKSYLWTFMSGSEASNKVVYFAYNPTRSGQFAVDVLTLNGDSFKGYLCVDGYDGYNKVMDATRVGCMAHVRRRFDDALKIMPNNSEKSLAKNAIEMIGELYLIETRIKEEPIDKKFLIRQQQSIPILIKIKDWLDDLHPKVLPKSLLGKAITYFLNEWEYVSRYVEDGRLSIDNNAAEREIKQVVIGRKNWLFADSVDGAHTNAIMYSLVATAKVNGLDPYLYLVELYRKVPNLKSSDELKALMPWNIKLQNNQMLKAA